VVWGSYVPGEVRDTVTSALKVNGGYRRHRAAWSRVISLWRLAEFTFSSTYLYDSTITSGFACNAELLPRTAVPMNRSVCAMPSYRQLSSRHSVSFLDTGRLIVPDSSLDTSGVPHCTWSRVSAVK
jgi:hypothetical protein